MTSNTMNSQPNNGYVNDDEDAAVGMATYRGSTVAYIFQKFQAYKYTIDNQQKQIEELVNSNALLEHDLNEAKSDIAELSWNLAGCDTIASGWCKPYDYDKSITRPALDAVSRMSEKLERVTKERDDADRRAGAANREVEDLQDSQHRRTRWLDTAKEQWGVHHNISFDVVWDEALKNKSELERASAERDSLLREVVEAFEFGDASHLHALLHVKNAVSNLKCDLAVEQKINAKLKNEYANLLSDATKLLEDNTKLAASIQCAIDYAGGRETEWGDRAISAFQILESALYRQPKE